MKKVIFFGLIAILGLTWYFTDDRFTWLLETIWVWAGIGMLVWKRNIRMTPLLTTLLVIHALVLILGGFYTYAKVPLGFWMQDWFDLSRNHYDRIGHFVQGFVPAILIREIYRRKGKVADTGWLFLYVTTFCLAFSAFFEMIEWWSALAFGAGADAFLATQGDVWDTQWDMFLCLIGAMLSLTIFRSLHERQLKKLSSIHGKNT